MSNPSFGGPRDRPRGSICEPLMQTTTAGRVILIHQLVMRDDLSDLKKELAKDIDLIEAKNSDGMTPLFQAVSCNNLECVQYLVTSGADIDAKDNLGRTPVALAAYQGWHDGLYYLLAKGANCQIADNGGRLPLHAATYFSSEKSLEVLLQHLSLEDVNAKDNEGMTALHWAAFHGRAGHVKVLVERKADVLTRDTDGKLPFHWAAQNGSLLTCQAMLQAPNSYNLVNGKDFTGRTPIHLAAAAGQFAVLVELTKVTFAKHEARDNDGRTPLHWAAATGHAHCVAHLLRLGANKEDEDNHGGTPLQYAQQGGHSSCSQLILEHDPNNPLLTEIPQQADNLQVPNNSRRTSDNTYSLDRVCNGIPHGSPTQMQTDPSDSEVLDIFCGGLVESTGTVQVHVEMNGQQDPNPGAGDMVSLLHDVSAWSGLTPPTSPYFLYPSTNGFHTDSFAAGYSSEEDCRYPPQMVLTPVPASPIPPEDGNPTNPTKPPILPRFSFEDQLPVIRPPGTAFHELAPIKSKTLPERLRLNIDRSGPVKPTEIKPSSPSTETHLAPLKVAAKAKQSSVTVGARLPPGASPNSTREVFTPEIKDNSKQLTRKGRAKADSLTLSPVSDNESDAFRKVKDKRPSAGGTAGQILPVISDKSSHVTQVTQGSRQDQLDAKKKNRRKTSKNRSIPEDLDVTREEEIYNGFEDNRSDRSIGNSKDKKKKKKVRKVMSWNF